MIRSRNPAVKPDWSPIEPERQPVETEASRRTHVQEYLAEIGRRGGLEGGKARAPKFIRKEASRYSDKGRENEVDKETGGVREREQRDSLCSHEGNRVSNETRTISSV